jgi:hypothetical protein
MKVQTGILNQPATVMFDNEMISREDIFSALREAGFEVEA